MTILHLSEREIQGAAVFLKAFCASKRECATKSLICGVWGISAERRGFAQRWIKKGLID
jgi:hypothetical protein